MHDFMMEVASPCAARVDTGAKRDDHAALDVRGTGAATRAETIPAQGPPATSCTATPTVSCQSRRAARTSRGDTAGRGFLTRWDWGQLFWMDPSTEVTSCFARIGGPGSTGPRPGSRWRRRPVPPDGAGTPLTNAGPHALQHRPERGFLQSPPCASPAQRCDFLTDFSHATRRPDSYVTLSFSAIEA